MLAVGAATPDLGRAAIAIVVLSALGLALVPAGPVGAAIVLAALLAGGTAGGAAIGARIEHAGHVLPVAVVSSLVDAVSVLTPGAPSDVVADTPALLSLLAISWPMPGTHDLPAFLGVGDVAFVGLYFAAARRHGLSLGRTAVALGAGLAATAVLVMTTAIALPALPFLGAAMLVAHPAARALPARDRPAALVGIALIALALVALVLSRRAG